LHFTQSRVSAVSIAGSVVVPISNAAGAMKIELSFEQHDIDTVFFTIQSFGLPSSDIGYFKVEGPLECIREVSSDGAVVSATILGTAMNAHNFFSVGETLVFALADNGEISGFDQVSIISRTTAHGNVCDSRSWDSFEFVTVDEGSLSIEGSQT